ncbi:polyserase-2 [Tachyglossus aculeatus]|uniref:polyserase-2 n=1 Tax=Tachyglossus aculeatus TaxID=9261 RepID=UPI0018F47A63|nr:polyserase-2 [Tachyglossus aculeatus]
MFPIHLLLLLVFSCDPGDTQVPDCGIPHPSARIVGGSESRPGAWPWQVSLHHDEGHICGGSLIADSWVLSAAHCVVDNGTMSEAEGWSAHLGLWSQDTRRSYEQHRAVVTILIPENYTSVEFGEDIALLRLATPANITDFVRTVCLPRATHRFPSGATCWATGWGDLQEEDPLPPSWGLQQVELRLLGGTACQCFYSQPGPFNLTFQLLPGMLCAGYREGRRDTCQGDSGGPLVCEEGGHWVQAGITSFGFGCGRRNRPGVFTAVARYEAWIREKTRATFLSQPEPPPSEPPEEKNCTLALPVCGQAPHPGTWPWRSEVVVPGASKPCHGVLVSDKWVLAPASCFLGSDTLSPNISGWRVLLPPGVRSVPITHFVPNENFTQDADYDLALLKLEAPVNLSEDIQPLCLPHADHYFLPSSRCRLAPWGRGGSPVGPHSVLEAELLSRWWCHCLHGQQVETAAPGLLCPLYREDSHGCWNASRWSLLCREAGTWFFAGAGRAPEGCARPKVFSALQSHGVWITRVTHGAYLEDQLSWDWNLKEEEMTNQTCPHSTAQWACGLRPGPEGAKGPWPWIAEVHVAGGQLCGGTLVAPGWVLAAAHCGLRQGSGASLHVFLGRTGATPPSLGHEISRKVTRVHLPTGSSSQPSFALLELGGPVEPSPSALPVCLHSGTIPAGARCRVLGWKDPRDRAPLAVPVSILPSRFCPCLQRGMQPGGLVCVLYLEGQEKLEIDSAPSLICLDKGGTWTLLGVAVRGSQRHFALVGTQAAWISQTVGGVTFVGQPLSPPGLPGSSDLCLPDTNGAANPTAPATLLLLLLHLLQN